MAMREPPHDMTLERSLLALCLDGSNEDAIDIAKGVITHCAVFWDVRHRVIYQACLDLSDRCDVVNASTVGHWLEGFSESQMTSRISAIMQASIRGELDGISRKPFKMREIHKAEDRSKSSMELIGDFSFLSELAMTYAPSSALMDICKRLWDLYTKRVMLRHYDSIMSDICRSNKTSDELLDAIVCTTSKLNNLTIRDNVGTSLRQGVLNAIARHDEVKSSNANGGIASRASWGVKVIDEKYPLNPGRMVVLTASVTGGGKTTLAGQAALATADICERANIEGDELSPNVLWWIKEMSPDDLGQRTLGQKLGMREDVWETGTVNDYGRDKAIAFVDGWTAGERISIESTSRTPTQLASKVRALHRKSPNTLKLLIIDYVQEFSPTNHNNSEKPMQTAVDEAARELGDLCIDLNLAILVLSQLTRADSGQIRKRDGTAGEYREPTIEGLVYGSNLSKRCNLALGLWTRGEAEDDRVPVDLLSLKRRHGGIRSPVHLYYDKIESVYKSY